MLCICYYYSWRVIIPAILTIGNNVIDFRPTHHSRLYSARGSTFITIEETEQSKEKKKKRKEKKRGVSGCIIHHHGVSQLRLRCYV